MILFDLDGDDSGERSDRLLRRRRSIHAWVGRFSRCLLLDAAGVELQHKDLLLNDIKMLEAPSVRFI